MAQVTEAEQLEASSMAQVTEPEQLEASSMAQVTEAEQLEASSMAQVTEAEQYQVFINHRGPDTKKNLASLIYHDLSSYGLRVFLDKEELRTGNAFCPAIRGAISSSSVYIAIFSKNYAQSPWCLNELCWMLKSSHERRFIPIFYDVEPADLRYIEKGCYAKAFDKHQRKGRVSMEVVEGWKKALGKAADITGHTFKTKKTKKSDQGKFVKEIEDIVIKQVKRDPLEVAAHPVGLDQASKDLQDRIQDRIQNGISTNVVVIAGLGGIGKSALARRIFNDLSRPVFGQPEFSRASYLCNVRETAINDPTSLQRRLHRDLLGKDRDIPTPNEGKTMLHNSLKGLKFLIVFDDVADGEEIKSVLNMEAVGPDSRIFITSCDKDILVTKKKTEAFVYHVQLLKKNDARELFCYHAFPQVAEGYADLVDKFLEFCDGLPLLLEVLGQEFAHKLEIEYWEKHLASFLEERISPSVGDSVIKKLKWSTQALEYKQKKMFLDVAYFLVGEDEELAVRVLEGFEEYGEYASDHLKNLGKKGLVSFKNDVERHDEIRNEGQDIAIPGGKRLILPADFAAVLPKRRTKIIMHNQLRALARYIISNEPPSRYHLCLSCSNDIEKMLQSQSGSVFCRGICIRKDRSPPQLTNNINIKDVHILVVEHPKDSSWILSCISGNLVWLRWRHSRLTSLPRTISVRNLRVLELGTSKDDLEEFLASIYEIPLQLREVNIDLSGEGASSSTSSRAQPVDHLHFTKTSLFHFLKCIGSSMKELRKIVLKNLRVPQSLPFDFSELKNLRHLDLSGSRELTTLPNSISQLLQLRHLALRGCINLSIPTHILGQITTLEHIDFKGCARLLQLPEGISSQESLRYLNLLKTNLGYPALNLEPLVKLEQLIIGSASFKKLSCSVENLILVKCDNLKEIHTPYLERLEIYDSRLTDLPSGIEVQNHLKVLTIYDSPMGNFALDDIVLYALTNLTLMRTSISEIIIPPGACPRLEIVDLSGNCQLLKLEVFQPTLVKLNLEGCRSLKYLRLELVHLKCLNINWCSELRMGEEEWSQLKDGLIFFSFSREFRWDEVQEKIGSMEKDVYEMVISQVQEKVGSMEKDEYEMVISQVQEKVRSMKNDDYEWVISQVQEKVQSMWNDYHEWLISQVHEKVKSTSLQVEEKVKSTRLQVEEKIRSKMFKLFMSITFGIKLSSMEEHKMLPEDEEMGLPEYEEMGPYLMCFLREKAEWTKCNDFTVRFVYTTATPTESGANETPWANETRCTIMSRHKGDILSYCKNIMAYGT